MSTQQRSHYVCSICNMSFMRLAALENHERLSHPANEAIIKASCQERAPNKKGKSKKTVRRNEGKRSPTTCGSPIEKVHSNGNKVQQSSLIGGSNSGKAISKPTGRLKVGGQNNSRHNGTDSTQPNIKVSDRSSVEDNNNNDRVLKLHSVMYKNGSYHCSNCRIKLDKIENLLTHKCRESKPTNVSSKVTCRDCGRSSSDCLCGYKLYHIAIEEKSVSCTKCGKIFPDDRIRCKHKSYHCDKGNVDVAAIQVTCTSGTGGSSNISTLGDNCREQVLNLKRMDYVKCSHCEKAFKDDLDLNNHMLSHKELSQFDCFFCRLVFSSGESLKNHLKTEHDHHTDGSRSKENDVIHTDSGTWYGCSLCPKVFTCKSNRRRHERWHFGIRPHSCDQCGAAFRQRWQLIAHKKSKRCKENRVKSRILHTGVENTNVQPAAQNTNQGKESELTIPLQTSDTEDLDKDETVADESSMKSGPWMHTAPCIRNPQTSPTPASQAPVPVVASVPTSSLSTGASCTTDTICLDQKFKYTNVFPEAAPLDLTKTQGVTQNMDGHNCFVCLDCGQVCKTKRNLVIHKRIHTGERPYTCSLCNLTFRQSHHRKAHMLSKHGVNHSISKPVTKQEIIVVTKEGIRYKCHHCSKVLMSRSGRRKHERWHLGLRPHKCNICGNTFKQLQHLKKHQMSSKCRSMRLLQTSPKKFGGNDQHVDQNSNAVVAPLTSLHMIQMFSKGGHRKRALDTDVTSATSPRDVPEIMDMPRALGLISTKELEAKKRAKENLNKQIVDTCNVENENGHYLWKEEQMQIQEQPVLQAKEHLDQSAGEVSEEELSSGKLVIATREADEVQKCEHIKEEVLSELEDGEFFEMRDSMDDSGNGDIDKVSLKANLMAMEKGQNYHLAPLNLSSSSSGGNDSSNSKNTDNSDKLNPVQCHICGQYYKSRQNLGIHMRMHTGERPYSCSVCNKKFIQPHHLKAHLKSKHDIIMVTPTKPTREDEIVDTPDGIRFKCQFCPKLLTSKNGRQKHERWHLGLRPHKCDVCGKAFKQSHHLKRHKIGTACIPPSAANQSNPQHQQGAKVFTVSQTLPATSSPVALLVAAAMLGSQSHPDAVGVVPSMAGLLVPSLSDGSKIVRVVQTNHTHVAHIPSASEEMVPEDLSMPSGKK